MPDAIARIAALPCWSNPVEPQPLGGGLTNQNFTVLDGGRKYAVRVGHDIREHQVMRFNELAASRAASRAGISPGVHYAEPGILVLDFIEGRTLKKTDIRQPDMLVRILDLVRSCHVRLSQEFRGPGLMFWVFHVIRDYVQNLKHEAGPHQEKLKVFSAIAEDLERAVGPVEIVFAHNDLVHGNFIDDGQRLWLIDWDYAGFNSPLFDLANLSANNGLAPQDERKMLEYYFRTPPGGGLWRRYMAMKSASALRETLWSMISQIHSQLDFDYGAYTAQNMAIFEQIHAEFRDLPEG